MYWSILSGLKSTLSAIVPNCDLRKRLELVEGDTLPMLLIAAGPGGEKKGKQGFNKQVAWLYPVQVAYVESAGGLIEASQGFFDVREAVRNKLYAFAAPGVASVWDFDTEPAVAVDPGPYAQAQLDVATWAATYTSAEQRS